MSEKPIHLPALDGSADSDTDAIAIDAPRGTELYVYVNECLDKGSTKNEVLKQLIAYGYSESQAGSLVEKASLWRFKHYAGLRSIDASTTSGGAAGHGGKANMWIGGLICLAGVIIIAASCMAARNGGGQYPIAYGAIIWGVIQFFRGMSQANKD